MLTPLDIENKKFSKQVMNGYNVEDVDDFLDELVVDYGKNYKELAEANLRIEKMTSEIEHYRNLETTLQNTLVMAQSTAEEVKSVAKQQADQLMNEARSQSAQLMNDAKTESERIMKDAQERAEKKLEELQNQIEIKEKRFEDVKKQFDIYKADMEAILLSQEDFLKKINKEDEE